MLSRVITVLENTQSSHPRQELPELKQSEIIRQCKSLMGVILMISFLWLSVMESFCLGLTDHVAL